MNKEIIVNNKTYLFVEVPNVATDFHYDSWFTRYINHSKGAIKLNLNIAGILLIQKVIWIHIIVKQQKNLYNH